MVSALKFKGDKKPLGNKTKKRKHPSSTSSTTTPSSSTALTTTSSIWAPATLTTDLFASPLTFTHSSHHLAADLAGTIFAFPTTGEDPDSVQCVFTAAPIYGSSVEDDARARVSIRSHAGRYLSVDAEGRLEAVKEAIGVQETWEVERVDDAEGGWVVRGYKGRYLGLGGIEPSPPVKADQDDDEEEEGEKKKVVKQGKGKPDPRGDCEESVEWRIKCQSRFKTHREEGSGEGRSAGKVVREKIGRRELERLAGGELDDEQVRVLKKAKREGNLNEALLDVRVKKGHDKFAY
ncbi:hypothetical protein EX30DRAFT_398378 [Ascodesmis nigricans]|uniref:Actin-crosslinking protein n=1 Tax=Ascodesmis nigricans TaxID=341454 RepID=A0A4S2MKZ2_9PEZI|nr:hypothetical protein EX30DRAFT_398378 [Ascodesmis nigricans]